MAKKGIKQQAARDREVGGEPLPVHWETEQADHDILTVAIKEGGYTMRGYLRRAVRSQYKADVEAKLLPRVASVGISASA